MNRSRMHKHRKESVTGNRGNARFRSAVVDCAIRCTIALQLPALLICGLICISGCRSLIPSDGEGIFANSDLLNTDRIRGPLERALQSEQDSLTQGQKFSAKGRRQVEAARKYFDDRKYPEALKAYDKIAKSYADSSIGEEAWFRMGECHFAMQEYPAAQDAYERLFTDYPSTKYVADSSRRLFSIAKIWLEVADPAAKSQIKTVSQQSEVDVPDTIKTRSSSKDLSARYSLIPNFFDKTRPVMDTRGRARKALKSIWLNDPTGPLADDALMLTASYYLRRGNYLEADRYFEILRDEYPESPHLEDAFVLGSHVKQLSYQGPYYDGASLVSAENLKERTLMMFPDSQDRQKVRDELNRLHLLKAQRAWARVELWQRKDNPRAVAIQCMQVINEFPNTRYADRARRVIQSTNPAVYRGLPGMEEFVQSLPDSPPASNQPTEPSASGPPVKSVSAPAENKRRFRFPGL